MKVIKPVRTAPNLLRLTVQVLLVIPLTSLPAWADVAARDYSALWQKFAANEQCWDKPTALFPYQDCFEKAARKYDLPLNLLLAVARGESDFNPRAKSKADCYGIMQILWPNTARDLGFSSPGGLYQPCKNIMAGSRYLKKMLDLYNGDIHLALAAYNYGPSRIPVDLAPWSLPDKAEWYSGYIYHHLERVAGKERLRTGSPGRPGPKKRYITEHKAPIIYFKAPFRARGFIEHIEQHAPQVRLDWFHNSFNEFYVVLLFRDDQELSHSLRALQRAGYEVKEEEIFH